MVSVLTSFSRITILSYILVFTIADLLLVFEPKLNETFSSIISIMQSVMVFMFHLNSALILFLARKEPNIIILTVLQIMLFIGIIYSLSRLSMGMYRGLVNNILLMLSFGFIFLERLSMERAIRQLIFAIISFVLSWIVIMILRRIQRIDRFLPAFLAVGIIGLFLVNVIGKVEYGAKLSLSFGNISVQPSEFVKLSFVFFIAACIVSYKDYRGFLISSAGALIHVLILIASKDLGTALIFVLAYVFLIFVAYKNYIVFTLEIIIGFVGGIMAYSMFPHIQSRFVAWTDPLSVVNDQGYQISQSLFAIGTGGWFGSGLCKGMPNKIPVVAKDFIFAAISEEMGAIVAVCLILIYLCTFIMILNVAFNCTNSFYMLVDTGIGIIFAVQTILNIGGVIKFIPSTGVTLPLISYGGSSLLSMLVSIFIIMTSDDLWGYYSREYYD